LKAVASASALATKAEPASFNGSFTQSVSIAVPVYHGLEPKVSLRYDSNAGVRAGGYWAGLVGVGFSLSGLSDITRSSAVGGAPRYADTDEFVLDGDRLVACTAGMTSPACTTGPTGAGVSYYATRVESFVRVKRIVSGTTTSWEVAARDGTVSSYVSPASVPGWYTNGAAPSTDAQLRDDTRWLLRKVTDTHGNEVVYDYACVSDPICWPASISYNGTRIAFNLEATSGAAKLSQATGKSIATLDRRLASIGITTANNRVRGYNLDYELSPATGYSRLTAVTQFGRDASLGQVRLTGGTSLPPTTFGWSGVATIEHSWVKSNNPAFKLDQMSRPGTNSGFGTSLDDVNSDRVPDRVLTNWSNSPAGGTINYPTPSSYCTGGSLIEAASHSRPVRTTGVGGGCIYTYPNPTVGSSSASALISAGDYNADGKPDYIQSTQSRSTVQQGGRDGGLVTTSSGSLSLVLSRPDGSYEPRGLAGVTYGPPSLGYSQELPTWHSPLDLNGDGVNEFVVTDVLLSSVTSKITSLTGSAQVDEPIPPVQRQQMRNGHQWSDLHYVDLNGDGKSDVYMVTGEGGTIRVTFAYSTGSGFTPLRTYDVAGSLVGGGVLRTEYWGCFSLCHVYPDGIDPDETWVLPADVNGDGKVDLITMEKNPTSGVDIGVFLSTGAGFVHQLWAQGIVITGGCASSGLDGAVRTTCLPRLLAGDLDGDGRQDLVINTATAPNPPLEDVPNSTAVVFLSRAGAGPNEEGSFVAVPGQLPSIGYVTDIDEDGRDDLIEGALRSPLGASIGFMVFQTGDYFTLNTAFPDLLMSVKEPLGASAAIAYTPSSAYPGPDSRPAGSMLPSIVQTVSSVTRDDGRGTVGTTDYSYSNALYNAAERRFLGFGMGVALLPANAGETVRPRIDYTFDQSLATAGRVLKTAYSTQTNATVLAREAESWSVMTTAGRQTDWPPVVTTLYDKACKDALGRPVACPADFPCPGIGRSATSVASIICTLVPSVALTLPYTAFNTGSEKQEIVAGVTRRSTVSRTYDVYGNVTQLLENGNADVTGDERVTITDHAPNTGAFITSLPWRTLVYKGTSNAGVVLSDTRTLYDGAGDAATPPVRGDQTGQWNWLNPGNRWITTSASYDAYGNKVSSTDALGNTTQTLYDTTYHLFPVEERNPLYVQNGDTRQKTQPITDPVCQTLTGMIDLNGQTTSYGYDGLCRITSVTQPLGTFKTFSYNAIGNPQAQFIQIETPGAAGQGNIWSQIMFDGYGREWKSEGRTGDPAQTATTLTGYDGRGNKASVTAVPFLAPSASATLVVTSFDSRDRPIKVTNPDNSFKTMSYEVADPASVAGAFLQTTTTDELNRKTVAVSDAYGRTVRQTAYKQGRALHRTLGYDGLGRLTSLSDPAGNTWTNVFDTLGRRTSVKDPDLGTWTYVYDDGGNLLTLTDAKGQKTGYNYDRLNRVTGQIMRSDLPDGDPQRDNIGFLYDEARSGAFNVGKQTTAANKHAWLTANYDALGN
ncbi:toxin TcdB middle/N-terminal domain-containing protein, partial [Labrys sp. KB_33_2]|uniref:toxin TcdB middle/N-terminal domain-containing protein n=1 Tax=Labrys sp. KB_33_2 TaxID=3237479 RepID=UPI003F911355